MIYHNEKVVNRNSSYSERDQSAINFKEGISFMPPPKERSTRSINSVNKAMNDKRY